MSDSSVTESKRQQPPSPVNEQCDDRQFGFRVMRTAVLASIPVWIGLLTALLLKAQLTGYIVALLVTLPIPLIILGTAFRYTKCPKCGQQIRVPWRSLEYRHGGMLRYTCDRCHIEWATHLYPGSDV